MVSHPGAVPYDLLTAFDVVTGVGPGPVVAAAALDIVLATIHGLDQVISSAGLDVVLAGAAVEPVVDAKPVNVILAAFTPLR